MIRVLDSREPLLELIPSVKFSPLNRGKYLKFKNLTRDQKKLYKKYLDIMELAFNADSIKSNTMLVQGSMNVKNNYSEAVIDITTRPIVILNKTRNAAFLIKVDQDVITTHIWDMVEEFGEAIVQLPCTITHTDDKCMETETMKAEIQIHIQK